MASYTVSVSFFYSTCVFRYTYCPYSVAKKFEMNFCCDSIPGHFCRTQL